MYSEHGPIIVLVLRGLGCVTKSWCVSLCVSPNMCI